MSEFDAETLVRQLAALGRELAAEVAELGRLDEEAVDTEGEYRRLTEEHEDLLAQALLASMQSNVEARRAEARVKCVPSRLMAQDAWLEWNRAKARLRTQQAHLNVLHRRVEIGRSLLSREKALISLAGVGET